MTQKDLNDAASRLNDVIENAKRKAVDELNVLDWHEGDLRKLNIIERAIRDVIAEMSNDPSSTIRAGDGR